ncbi:uncharacterized protein LY89DRAFT_489628 [Mollisia scopiformis]|uniref:C2H2-type domain-containing protein n=1 Tax=Mollisia scopiformis TaxID=149040 RepID=A0A194XGX7_MOLSC|nr:uncharacterized protein LY89DRAFT_489628 [Mollisia scopiformis]KUJ19396.1 hypothetical protein LY89DRAFT_489628 [Mollisia scopiformis]
MAYYSSEPWVDPEYDKSFLSEKIGPTSNTTHPTIRRKGLKTFPSSKFIVPENPMGNGQDFPDFHNTWESPYAPGYNKPLEKPKFDKDATIQSATSSGISVPCGFAFLGCEYKSSNSRGDWTSHTLSHLKDVPPLHVSICHVPQCPFVGQANEHPKNVWSDRLDHCWSHFIAGHPLEEFLQKNRLLYSQGTLRAYRYGSSTENGNVFRKLATLREGVVCEDTKKKRMLYPKIEPQVEDIREKSLVRHGHSQLVKAPPKRALSPRKSLPYDYGKDMKYEVPWSTRQSVPSESLFSTTESYRSVNGKSVATSEFFLDSASIPDSVSEILSVANLTLEEPHETTQTISADHDVIMESQGECLTPEESDKAAPISSPASARTSIMESTCSEDETDWDGESSEGSAAAFQDAVEDQLLVKHKLTSAQADLVNRLMKEFWVLFHQRWKARTNQHGAAQSETSNTTTATATATSSSSMLPPTGWASVKAMKRSRSNEDGDSENERDRPSKRKGKEPASIDASEVALRYACPYRKHNPRKYSVQAWRRCALTPHTSVARVKAHLYKYHTIHQCPRCKNLFPDITGLEEHTLAPDSCLVQEAEQVDGITTKLRQQLQDRRKAFPGQTESDRWIQIFKIIFQPGEGDEIPDPYFEDVRDTEPEPPLSPESRVFAEYEGHFRRELPRHFQHILETTIISEMQPIEGRIRQQFMAMLEEAQNRTLSSFRARFRPAETPLDGEGMSSTQQGESYSEMLEASHRPLSGVNFDSLSVFNISDPVPDPLSVKDDNLQDSAYISDPPQASSPEDNASWNMVSAVSDHGSKPSQDASDPEYHGYSELQDLDFSRAPVDDFLVAHEASMENDPLLFDDVLWAQIDQEALHDVKG